MAETSSGPKHYTLTPWKVALTGSITSIIFAIPHAMIPALHDLSLPFGYTLQTSYFILGIAALSILWALLGMRRRLLEGNFTWCVFSLALSVTAAAFTIVSSMSA